MRLQRFDSAAAFLDHARSFLSSAEAENNVLLGIAASMRDGPGPSSAPMVSDGLPPYFAAIEHDGNVIAAAIRTPPQDLVLSTVEPTSTSAAMTLLAADYHDVDPTLPGVSGPAYVVLTFAHAWAALSGGTVHKTLALRIYRLDRVAPPAGVAGSFRRATTADRETVIRWITSLLTDLGEPRDAATNIRIAEQCLTPRERASEPPAPPNRALYLWLDGDPPAPVSMAGAAGWTPHGVRINLVYTPPEHRRRGYASACVAALSQLLIDAGRHHCFLFTDLANPTSNHIYQQIGYRPVADIDTYAFTYSPLA